MGLFTKRRYRAQKHLALSALADNIDARSGVVLKDSFSGGKGLNGPLTLGVITLRNGLELDVAQAQIDAAVAAGYTNPPKPPRSDGYFFTTTRDMPILVFVTYEAGTAIPLHGEVPAGQTGVSVSLT
jgi:hypothetical protein